MLHDRWVFLDLFFSPKFKILQPLYENISVITRGKITVNFGLQNSVLQCGK